MSAPFAKQLLGWKKSQKNKLGWPKVPNCADTDNAESLRIAAGMLDILFWADNQQQAVPASPGGPLEKLTRSQLGGRLRRTAPERRWDVRCGVALSEFAQYVHLNALHQLVARQPELRVTIGMDYLIKPDVTIAIQPEPDDIEPAAPFLHGVVSCKWTIRSDRVQNIRHEYGQMIRHRRGRLPHLVTLTAEPLPSRLASIARGTGEVDTTYHVAFDALAKSVASCANKEQQEAWDECVRQGRLKSYADLPDTLARW